MEAHPEFADRLERFLIACDALGWGSYVYVLGRDTETQAWLRLLWVNYLNGRSPSRAVEAADPYKVGDLSPWGWRCVGSKHQPQRDGYVHAADITLNRAPQAEFHRLGAHFGLAFPLPKEPWHVEWWLDGVIVERHDHLIPQAAPEPPRARRGIMPVYIIKGERPTDAWFAIYQSGLGRHIGGDEAGFLIGKGIEVITERDRAAYLELIAWSGTDWRPVE